MLRFRRAFSLLLTVGAIALLAACGQVPNPEFLDDGINTQGSARISNVSFRRGSLTVTGRVDELQFFQGEDRILTITVFARAQRRCGTVPSDITTQTGGSTILDAEGELVIDFNVDPRPIPFHFEVVVPDPFEEGEELIESRDTNTGCTWFTDWLDATIVLTTGGPGGEPVDLVETGYDVDCDPFSSDCESEELVSAVNCLGQPATVYVDDNGIIVGGWNDGATYRPGRTLLKGTSGPDVIVGTDERDIIVALSGDDLVCAGDDHDRIFGGHDNDLLLGEAGNDRIYGGFGFFDAMNGGEGHDRLYDFDGNVGAAGGPGDDRISVRIGYGWPFTAPAPSGSGLVSVYDGALVAGTGDDRVSITNRTGRTMVFGILGDELAPTGADGTSDCYNLFGRRSNGFDRSASTDDGFEFTSCY